ncbi:hypothetical protein ACFV1L_11995 [Kitasatospora sp. NPDC059646]|uniref:hypothetical protein n=1 Tax=Kitasatospora sp. NPDC059646 TaxID=3346893 RepID=UPI0036C9DAB7
MADRKRPDRTKNGPTPKRGARPSPSPAGAVSLLLPLLGAAFGVLLVLGGLGGVRQLAEQHRRPELRVLVDSCAVRDHGRSRTVSCHGTRDPGSTDVIGARLQLHDAPKAYAPGTAVKARCTSDGVCDVLTAGNHVLALGLVVGGLLVTGGALAAFTTRAVDLFAPHRAEALRHRLTRRTTVLAAVGAVLLTVAGLLARLFL